jgi:NAD(P)-dependent dehydrogenase (short-subunit alcohol dehydrogenase family)
MQFEDRLIVITGGAGGIARPTARLLLDQRARLLLIDPDAGGLQALAAELDAGDRVRTASSTSPASSAPMPWTRPTARSGMRRSRPISPTPSTSPPPAGRGSTRTPPHAWCS